MFLGLGLDSIRVMIQISNLCNLIDRVKSKLVAIDLYLRISDFPKFLVNVEVMSSNEEEILVYETTSKQSKESVIKKTLGIDKSSSGLVV